MKCSKVRLLLSAMIDGELGRSEEEVVLRHVDSCERCRRELSELRRLRSILGSLPVEPLPFSVRIGVLSAINADLPPRPMSCEEARQAMHLLLDGEAPAAVEGAVRAHMALCRECAREFEGLRRGVELVRMLPKVEPPAWLLEPSRYVRRAEPAWRPLRPPSWALRPSWAFAVAALVFAVLFTFGTFRGKGTRGVKEVAVTAPKRVVVAHRPLRAAEVAPSLRAKVGEPRPKVRAERAEAKPAPSPVEERALQRPAEEVRGAPSPKGIKPEGRPRVVVVAQRRAPSDEGAAQAPQRPKVEGGEVTGAPQPVLTIKRPATAEAGAPQQRELQREEVRPSMEKPSEAHSESQPERKGPQVELAMSKEGKGIEVVRIDF